MADEKYGIENAKEWINNEQTKIVFEFKAIEKRFEEIKAILAEKERADEEQKRG